jgi:hypothetical protein
MKKAIVQVALIAAIVVMAISGHSEGAFWFGVVFAISIF